jgi:hypothetical protein
LPCSLPLPFLASIVVSEPANIPAMNAQADNVPLRLRDAAKLAFPMGGVTERTLRREHKRGRLTIYEIGGKHFTTLRDIADMTRACRAPKPPCVSVSALAPDTTRALEAALDALDKL